LRPLAEGFAVALTIPNLFYGFVGVTLGTFVGVLPGIGPALTVALLLPVTFNLDPTAALIMFAGIYYGAMYGGSTTSILLNTPGESATMVTAMEGHQMARSGRAGAALLLSILVHAGEDDAGDRGMALQVAGIATVGGYGHENYRAFIIADQSGRFDPHMQKLWEVSQHTCDMQVDLSAEGRTLGALHPLEQLATTTFGGSLAGIDHAGRQRPPGA